MKRLLVIGIAVLSVAAVWAAASPCTDLSRCAQAAEEYCEQIEGVTATSAEILVEFGESTCNWCCSNGVCRTMRCS